MKLAVIIQDPFDPSSLTCPRYVEAACKQHEVVLVFFQFDAVHVALTQTNPNPAQELWVELAEKYNLKLLACQGSLESRKIESQDLATGFHAGSYGMLTEAMDDAEQVITFGSGA